MEHEYEHDYDTDVETETDVETDMEYETETEGSEATFTSFQAELEDMIAGLLQLDNGLSAIAETTQTLEKPLTTVAVQAFTNPRVLEAAPFRQTKFRLLPAAKTFLHLPHNTILFAELGAAIRQAIRERKTEVEEMWGTSDFLGILRRLPEIVE
jgi:hypothetical protein